MEPSYIAGRILKWCNCFGKQFGMSSKVKCRVPYDPVILLLVIYSREMKTYIHIKTFTCSFIAALFIIAKKWKQSKYSSADE